MEGTALGDPDGSRFKYSRPRDDADAMKRVSVRIWMVLVAGLVSALPAMPAVAAEKSMCPTVVMQQSFYDVDGSNPHAYDIDCLALLSVVNSGGAFLPAENLTRWEMGQWLTRSASWLQRLPQDPPRTFQDTGSLTTEARISVEQMRMLGITQGIGNNLYAPYDAVPRWQMALFLTRFVTAVGSDLPAPSDPGFTDLGGLSSETLNAISQLRYMGITQGTSPTTFSPHTAVTREQMASFVARTLERAWVFLPDHFIDVCDDIVPTGETVEVSWCSGSGYDLPIAPFRVRDHVMFTEPITSIQLAGLQNPATHSEIFINGVAHEETVRLVQLPGVTYKFFDVTLPGTSYNTHVQADFYLEGQIYWVLELDMVFDY